MFERAAKDAAPEWDDIKEQQVLRKINRQVLLKFCILTVLNYLDRTNLAFAAPRMNKDLHFSDSIYANGASIFFVGYALFQVPSNLILLRLGGRVWLSIMLVAWGIAATAFAGMQRPVEFYVLRFLLGLAECGTFPGMWFHLSLFYDSTHMGVAYGTIVAAVVLSQVLGGPIAAGWRWLFIMEGVPTVLFGLYMYRTLADGPCSDGLLTLEEQGWLLQRLARDKTVGSSQQARTSWDGAGNWRTWYCAIISFQNAIAKYAILYWTPLVIYELLGPSLNEHHRDWVVALLTGIPFGLAAVATMVVGKHSKQTGELQKHVWVPMVAAGAALLGLSMVLTTQPVLAFVLLVPATLLWANEGVFMSWPRIFLQGPAAATGVALINSGMLILACIVLFNAVLAAVFPMPTRSDVPGVQTSSGSSMVPMGPAAYKLLQAPAGKGATLGKVVRSSQT